MLGFFFFFAFVLSHVFHANAQATATGFNWTNTSQAFDMKSGFLPTFLSFFIKHCNIKVVPGLPFINFTLMEHQRKKDQQMVIIETNSVVISSPIGFSGDGKVYPYTTNQFLQIRFKMFKKMISPQHQKWLIFDINQTLIDRSSTCMPDIVLSDDCAITYTLQQNINGDSSTTN